MITSLLSWLNRKLPCFPMNGSQVHVITEPQGFYETLKTRASVARHRITLASLYLGTGCLEKELVDVIKSRLCNTDLKVNVLLDYTRGSRGVVCSRTVLLPLLKTNTSTCKVHLYHTPALRGLRKFLLPDRWNEVIGLQHMKIYVIDNSVIISGANLSNDYFTNRQDRYVLFENVPELADYLDGLVYQVSQFSLQLQSDDSVKLCDGWTEHPYKGNFSNFCSRAKTEIFSYIQKHMITRTEKDYDTFVYPAVGMGVLGIHQDKEVTDKILESDNSTHTHLTTGYFNLTTGYEKIILNKSASDFNVLMAHPLANGFFGAGGAAGGIPFAYTILANNFFNKIQLSGEEHRITLHEYERKGWTFHGKGLWQSFKKNTALPYLTMIGSPNFGYRSVWRDLESQVVIVTWNTELQRTLAQERDGMFSYAKPVTQTTFTLPDRKPPLWVTIVTRLFRNFF